MNEYCDDCGCKLVNVESIIIGDDTLCADCFGMALYDYCQNGDYKGAIDMIHSAFRYNKNRDTIDAIIREILEMK